MRGIHLLFFLCMFSSINQIRAFSLIPDRVKRSCSSILNTVGASCYYLSGKYAPTKPHEVTTPSPIHCKDIPRIHISFILEKCGDAAYALQSPLATQAVKNPYALRNFLLNMLNISSAACHYTAGMKAANDDVLSQSMATFLHRLGNASHQWHIHLARYDGILKTILDNTDLSKKSHLLATLLVAALATHLSYKLYKNLIYKPLAYAGDALIYQPSKKICEKAYAKLTTTLHDLTSNDNQNQSLDTSDSTA